MNYLWDFLKKKNQIYSKKKSVNLHKRIVRKQNTFFNIHIKI